MDDAVDMISVMKAGSNVEAMLYQESGCRGTMTIITATPSEVNPSYSTSGAKYARAKAWTWEPGQMKSVDLPADSDLEVFNARNFKADSIVHKNHH